MERKAGMMPPLIHPRKAERLLVATNPPNPVAKFLAVLARSKPMELTNVLGLHLTMNFDLDLYQIVAGPSPLKTLCNHTQRPSMLANRGEDNFLKAFLDNSY